MQKTIIDTSLLNDIPEEHRAQATSYEAPDSYWMARDSEQGLLPDGVSVGDLREAGHTRYTVTFSPNMTYNYD